MSSFSRERASVAASGRREAVTVDQRSLIDKILARYATAFSVYRELLQNSNDANAHRAEIRFTAAGNIVQSVVYRNDGSPFSDADFARLTCIASGNPSPEKIGAFGVGAYALFSICDNPLLVSGGRSLLFEWDGDGLVARHGKRAADSDMTWTSFELPARDPYDLPDMAEFGAFLASSLAFTKHLTSAEVFVNDVSVLAISKRFSAQPVAMRPPVDNSSWWSRRATLLSSPASLFSLSDTGLVDSALEISARYGAVDAAGTATETLSARVVSAEVTVDASPAMRRRMERVTKKSPMSRFPLRLILGDSSAGADRDGVEGGEGQRRARAMLEQFAPRLGAGRLYIGFRTSQTTGLAAHVEAGSAFIPTVEREQVDLTEPTLAIWNGELLFIAGVLLRMSLEHGMMSRIGGLWEAEAKEREGLEKLRLERIQRSVMAGKGGSGERAMEGVGKERQREPGGSRRNSGRGSDFTAQASEAEGKRGGMFSGLTHYMKEAATSVKLFAVSVVESVSDDPANLLTPPDPQPATTKAEREAILLMRSFVPTRSTPDSRVGAYIAKGFEGCLPNLAAPVLTTAGVVRSSEAFSANSGMEGFLAYGDGPAALVRSVVLANVRDYVKHVCRVSPLTINLLATHLQSRVLSEDEALLLLNWFVRYARKESSALDSVSTLKNSVSVLFSGDEKPSCLRDYMYFASAKSMRKVPLQPETLPVSFSSRLSESRVLREPFFSSWFSPLSWSTWSKWIVEHECLTAERSHAADATRLAVFSCLAGEVLSADGRRDSPEVVSFVKRTLGSRKCLPIEGGGLEKPVDSYLPIAQLETFTGVSLPRVCSVVLTTRHVTEQFLVAIGVREAVSLDVLFTELDRLAWTQDPTGLVNYLFSVKEKLSRSELRRLRETRFLPSTADTDLHAPSELVLPLPELKGLPFVPFLRWRGSLLSSSPTASFLSEVLEMRAEPPLKSLLLVAADEKTVPAIRRKCIEFAAARLDGSAIDSDFRSQLRANSSLLRDCAFIPCRRVEPVPGWVVEEPKGKLVQLCAPQACFTDRSCSVAGFWVVDSEFEIAASRFHVPREPSGPQYCKSLLRIVGAAISLSEGSDEVRHAIVWRLFEFLATRVHCFSNTDKQFLRGTAFVPAWVSSSDDTDMKTLVWRRPGDVYFDSGVSSSITSYLFETVPTNEFLRFSGVSLEPTLSDLVNLIIRNPEAIFEKMHHDRDRYGELLHRVSAQLSSQSQAHGKSSALLNQLKRTPFLLASKFDEKTFIGEGQVANADGNQVAVSGSDESEGEAVTVQQVTFVLAHPADIFIVDDTLLQRMFNPLSMPNELIALEGFYRQLGSNFLSSAVSRLSEIPRFGHGGLDTDLARELKSRILQRRALILETSNRPLANGAAGLLSDVSLHVRQVPQISSICVLKGTRKTQSVSCCSNRALSGKLSLSSLHPEAKLVLFITDEMDFFDVADSLGRQLYLRCGLQDIFLLAQLLETTLAQLRARGFPVDRIRPVVQPTPPSHIHSVENVEENNRSQDVTTSHSTAAGEKIRASGYSKLPSSDETPAETPAAPSRPVQMTPPDNTKGEGSRNFPKALMKAFKKRSTGLAGLGLGTNSKDTAVPTPSAAAAAADSSERDVKPNDARSRDGTRQALSSAVKATAAVPPSGVTSPETQNVVQDAPSRALSCEVIPAQDLAALTRGNLKAKTSHGLRVFASRHGGKTEESLQFCLDNWAAVERFSYLLSDLARVFRLETSALAIFYATSGRTIAFNSNGSLFFNLRYFMSLHENSRHVPQVDAWVFWYTTTAHELAHNLSQSHDQKHGFYTEAFISEFFPVFFDGLRAVGL